MGEPITWVLTALVVVFGGLVWWVYDGYLRCLRIAHRLAGKRFADASTLMDIPGDADADAEAGIPDVTGLHMAVLVGVHNEAHQIVERVRNVLDQDVPGGRVEVVLASDGSTDDLAAIVSEHFGEDVRIVHSPERVGKSQMQNQAMASIDADIVVFSDADTRFAPGFLRAVVAPFADPTVGAVQAHLLFGGGPPGSLAASQGRYWRAELAIRQLEASFGVLAVASGACIAIRRSLWCPLDPAYGDDCMIPLDVVAQGHRVAYAPGAVAHEPADGEFDRVIANRTRMTLRNWQGTWSRSELLNPRRQPGYAFALWSHKVLRWLSPVWLLGFAGCAIALGLVGEAPLAWVPAVGFGGVALAAAVGWLGATRSIRVPMCASVYAFALANVGFAGGLVKAIRGQRISSYQSR